MKRFFCLIGCYILLCMPVLAIDMEPSRYIEVHSTQLQGSDSIASVAVYESEGVQGPGVLLVHGNSSSAFIYHKILSTRFAKRHRVVAVDLPGFGQSADAENYNMQLFADVIAQVANATNTQGGMIVGWSLGGNFVLQALGRNLLTEASGVLILGASPLGQAPPQLSSLSPFLPNPLFALGATAELNSGQVVDYVSSFFPADYRINNGAFSQLLKDGFRADPATRDALLNVIRQQDPTFVDEVVAVTQSAVPIMLVLGELEPYINIEFLQALSPSIPNLVSKGPIVIPNVGHSLPWERPGVFLRILKWFQRRYS